jgi:hypothetical protein
MLISFAHLIHQALNFRQFFFLPLSYWYRAFPYSKHTPFEAGKLRAFLGCKKTGVSLVPNLYLIY